MPDTRENNNERRRRIGARCQEESVELMKPAELDRCNINSSKRIVISKLEFTVKLPIA